MYLINDPMFPSSGQKKDNYFWVFFVIKCQAFFSTYSLCPIIYNLLNSMTMGVFIDVSVLVFNKINYYNH